MTDHIGPRPLRVYMACCRVWDSGRHVTVRHVRDELPDDDPAAVLEAMWELEENGLLRMEWKPMYRVEIEREQIRPTCRGEVAIGCVALGTL